MNVGPGQEFEKVTVHTQEGVHNIPGLELVGVSKVMRPSCFAIGNITTSTNTLSIQKIRTAKAYDRRKDFIKDIQIKSCPS